MLIRPMEPRPTMRYTLMSSQPPCLLVQLTHDLVPLHCLAPRLEPLVCRFAAVTPPLRLRRKRSQSPAISRFPESPPAAGGRCRAPDAPHGNRRRAPRSDGASPTDALRLLVAVAVTGPFTGRCPAQLQPIRGVPAHRGAGAAGRGAGPPRRTPEPGRTHPAPARRRGARTPGTSRVGAHRLAHRPRAARCGSAPSPRRTSRCCPRRCARSHTQAQGGDRTAEGPTSTLMQRPTDRNIRPRRRQRLPARSDARRRCHDDRAAEGCTLGRTPGRTSAGGHRYGRAASTARGGLPPEHSRDQPHDARRRLGPRGLLAQKTIRIAEWAGKFASLRRPGLGIDPVPSLTAEPYPPYPPNSPCAGSAVVVAGEEGCFESLLVR